MRYQVSIAFDTDYDSDMPDSPVDSISALLDNTLPWWTT